MSDTWKVPMRPLDHGHKPVGDNDVFHKVAEIISDIHGFHKPAEPDGEHALRNAIARMRLQDRADMEQKIEDIVEMRISELIGIQEV